MGRPWRPDAAGDVRASGATAACGRRARGRAARQPSRGLPAPEGAQGGGPRDRSTRRQPPHLSRRSGGGGGLALAARPVLESSAGDLQGGRRAGRGGGRMTTQAQSETVRQEIVVEAPVDRAFRVFTEQMDKIKPRDRVVFTWNLSPSWQLEPNPERRSEVEVRFTAEAAERTRVALEHRHLDRQGDGWEGVRDGVAGSEGWSLYLQRFTDLLTD